MGSRKPISEPNISVPVSLELEQGVYFYQIRSHGETLDEGRIIISK
jgi:hypothetical protein